MKRSIWRLIIVVIVLTATVSAFIYYFLHHPQVRHQLRQVSPVVLVSILALYFLFTASLALINTATLRLCNVQLPQRESLLLTMYSSIINFFGPLQSGPAFRALYVKKKYNVNLKNYAQATLMYYVFYAFFSGLELISGVLHWWLIALIAAAGIAAYGYLHSNLPGVTRIRLLNLRAWYLLALATFLQTCVLVLIYYLELHAIAPHVHFAQVVIYSGAANLALFVSLTPGAIGFRESFLIFSQKLHHISTNTIVAANTVDRAIYIVLMLLLALGIFGTHTSKRFSAKSLSD